MAYWELSDNSCQICVYQMKKRQARDSKDGNKQVGKKTEMISLNTVLFSRLCVCDSRDIGSSWCGKSPMERTAPSPWKLIMAQETPNATLNEMSHPGECHMNQRPSLRILRRLFVSAEEILLAAGRKNSNMECVTQTFPDPRHGCFLFVVFYPSLQSPKYSFHRNNAFLFWFG